ncbi:MAG: hypothetical protein AAGF87_05695 [Bacteroidota bacterium]
MLRFTCFVLYFLLFCTSAVGQSDKPLTYSDQLPKRLNLADRFVAVHLEPTSFLRVNGFIRLGATVQRQNLAYLLDFTFGQGSLGGASLYSGEPSSGYRYRGFRPEIRYHWPRYWGNYYIGLEYGYADIRRELGESSYFDPSLSPAADIFAFEAGQRRTIRHSMLFKFGHGSPLFRKLYLDAFIGIGHTWRTIRFRNLRNVQVNLNAQDGRRAADGRPLSQRFRQGFRGFFTIEFGIRIGLRFEQRNSELLDE